MSDVASIIYRPIDRFETKQAIRLLQVPEAMPYYYKISVPVHLRNCCVDRFYWRCIVRGEENKGVQWFMMGKHLHKIITDGILSLPIQPTLTWKQKFFQKCANLSLFRWVGLSRRLMKLVPQPTNCLDPLIGYDFVVRIGFTGQTPTNQRVFPTYDQSNFEPQSLPAGTPEQIATWQQQILTMEPPKVNQPLI